MHQQQCLIADDIPFGVGHQLIVDLPLDERGTIDCYIDDTVGLTIDIPESDNASKMEHAPLLAIHTIS